VDMTDGWLVLKVQPWAKVSMIKNEQGKLINVPLSITPCRIPLKAGKYEVTLTNSQFKTLVIQVEIKPKEELLVTKTMEGFDYARAVDSLDL
jgi:PEGA domain